MIARTVVKALDLGSIGPEFESQPDDKFCSILYIYRTKTKCIREHLGTNALKCSPRTPTGALPWERSHGSAHATGALMQRERSRAGARKSAPQRASAAYEYL